MKFGLVHRSPDIDVTRPNVALLLARRGQGDLGGFGVSFVLVFQWFLRFLQVTFCHTLVRWRPEKMTLGIRSVPGCGSSLTEGSNLLVPVWLQLTKRFWP